MQCELAKLDGSPIVVDTNCFIFRRDNQQELIGLQAMRLDRTGREIKTASKLSHQTFNRNSRGITNQQHRKSTSKVFLCTSNPF